MFAQEIHTYLDQTFGEQEKSAFLRSIEGNSDAMAEYTRQRQIHELVALDKSALLADAESESDLAAIFLRASSENSVALGAASNQDFEANEAPENEEEKKKILPIPFFPHFEAHAPEHPLGSQEFQKSSFGNASKTAPIKDSADYPQSEHQQRNKKSRFKKDTSSARLGHDKQAQQSRTKRRFVPIVGRFALQLMTFCVVGAVAATFGVMPIGNDKTAAKPRQNNAPAFDDAPQNTPHQREIFSMQHGESSDEQGELPRKEMLGKSGNTGLLAGILPEKIAFVDSLQMKNPSVKLSNSHQERMLIASSKNEVKAGYDAVVKNCYLRGIKRPSWYLDGPTIPYSAAYLEDTKLPKQKRIVPKQDFKPFLALTARGSTNSATSSGFATSIGALYAVSPTDAFGAEIGGAFSRVGYADIHEEQVVMQDPIMFIAAYYRASLQVENTPFTLYGQLRGGIESTGAVFGGIALGAQYQIGTNFFVFMQAELAKQLSTPTGRPFNLAHDGISLGLAVKL